jgi:hypothetical protein
MGYLMIERDRLYSRVSTTTHSERVRSAYVPNLKTAPMRRADHGRRVLDAAPPDPEGSGSPPPQDERHPTRSLDFSIAARASLVGGHRRYAA